MKNKRMGHASRSIDVVSMCSLGSSCVSAVEQFAQAHKPVAFECSCIYHDARCQHPSNEPVTMETTMLRKTSKSSRNIHRLPRLALVCLLIGQAHADSDLLAAGFANPPAEARPQVWWHWIGGNISLEGAKLDLAWMRRVGIGGVHTFTGGGLGGVHLIEPPVDFMSAEWKHVFRETTSIARSTGMEVTIAGSPGWSETGGTWVEPRDAMKKYVWSETHIAGGKAFLGTLTAPPAATGPFLAVKTAQRGHARELTGDVYEDSFVVAFPTPAADSKLGRARYSTRQGPIDLTPLGHDDLSGSVPVSVEGGSAFITADFDVPTTVSALTLGLQETTSVEIQSSDDGEHFRTLLTAAADSSETPAPQQTYSFLPTRAKRFRAVLTASAPKPPLPGLPSALIQPPAPIRVFNLTEFRFTGSARVNRFESKAGFQATRVKANITTPNAASDAVIPATGVVNLTSKLRPDGGLDWNPPKGDWTVLRFGWSLTGQTNGPAEPNDTGLEVDKLDGSKVRAYMEHYLAMHQAVVERPLGDASIQGLLTDSWEAGVQNWTPLMLAEFRTRRGYEPAPYLPVLAGRVVGDASTSDRFLRDYYQTLKDLLADNHYGVLASVLHEHGMHYYTEAQGDTPRSIGDGMTNKSRSDIPTAEFWYRPFATAPGQPSLVADLQEAASAAHVYGKPLVACESLTVAAGNDPWSFSPAMLKPVADQIFGLGVNRILMHDSHHQPLPDKAPGLEMFFFGQYFNRNDTWAKQAGPWVDYLARSSFLLQQGHFAADIAYFYGEDRNLTERYLTSFNTDVPRGFAFDYINAESLLRLLTVQDGKLVTRSGTSYRLLYIPADVTRWTLPTLRKLRDLVNAGAVVVGNRPTGGLGLADEDFKILEIAAELWGSDESPGGHAIGRGKVYGTADLKAALSSEGVAPDAIVEDGAAMEDAYLTVHRSSADADIYFLSNRQSESRHVNVSLRVQGRIPEIWHAEDGRREQVAFRMTRDGVQLPLDLGPHESLFVVLRKATTEQEHIVPPRVEDVIMSLNGPWEITFQAGRGAPAKTEFDHLSDWRLADVAGIKYFSGEATYHQSIVIPRPAHPALPMGRDLILDLGEVHELAEVTIDGQRIGNTWHAPFQVKIPASIKPGRHRLQIKVVNLWVNRLIGDKQPGASVIAFAPQSPYGADSPLLPSGLLGPVRLLSRTGETVL